MSWLGTGLRDMAFSCFKIWESQEQCLFLKELMLCFSNSQLSERKTFPIYHLLAYLLGRGCYSRTQGKSDEQQFL